MLRILIYAVAFTSFITASSPKSPSHRSKEELNLESQKRIAIHTISTYLTHCSILILYPFRLTAHANSTTLREDVTALPDEFNFYQSLGNVRSILALDTSSVSNRSGSLPVYKMSQNCAGVVSFIPKASPEVTFSTFLGMITATGQNAITRRDLDYFVVVADNIADIQKTGSWSQMFRKLRYRIIIANKYSSDGTPEAVKIYSSDMFGMRGVLTLETFSLPLQKPKLELDQDQTYLSNVFMDYTGNLYGHPLKVAGTIRYVPFYELKKDPITGEYEDVRGVVSLFHKEVQRKLNTTYKVFVCNGFGMVEDGSSGILLKNGTYIGCMGDIISERADLSMLVSGWVLARYPLVESGPPIAYTYISFVTRKPLVLLSWKAIYKSFTWDAWTGVAVSLLATAVLLWSGDKIHLKQLVKVKSEQQSRWKLAHQIFNLFKGLLSQSLDIPQAVTAKGIVLMWLLYALIIGTAYTSKLTALIAFPETEVIPGTMRDLAVSKYGVGCPLSFKRGLGYLILKTSPVAMIKRVFEKMDFDGDDFKCLEKAMSSNFACISWEISTGFSISTRYSSGGGGHSPLIYSKDPFYLIAASNIAQKWEPIMHKINKYAYTSFDSGLSPQIRVLDMLKVRLKLKKEQQEKGEKVPGNTEGDERNVSLSLGKVFGSILIFAMGSLVALGAFITELGWEYANYLLTGRMKAPITDFN